MTLPESIKLAAKKEFETMDIETLSWFEFEAGVEWLWNFLTNQAVGPTERDILDNASSYSRERLLSGAGTTGEAFIAGAQLARSYYFAKQMALEAEIAELKAKRPSFIKLDETTEAFVRANAAVENMRLFQRDAIQLKHHLVATEKQLYEASFDRDAAFRKIDQLKAEVKELEAKLERYELNLKKIAIEDENNSNFCRSEDECSYYIQIARQALKDGGE